MIARAANHLAVLLLGAVAGIATGLLAAGCVPQAASAGNDAVRESAFQAALISESEPAADNCAALSGTPYALLNESAQAAWRRCEQAAEAEAQYQALMAVWASDPTAGVVYEPAGEE